MERPRWFGGRNSRDSYSGPLQTCISKLIMATVRPCVHLCMPAHLVVLTREQLKPEHLVSVMCTTCWLFTLIDHLRKELRPLKYAGNFWCILHLSNLNFTSVQSHATNFSYEVGAKGCYWSGSCYAYFIFVGNMKLAGQVRGLQRCVPFHLLGAL